MFRDALMQQLVEPLQAHGYSGIPSIHRLYQREVRESIIYESGMMITIWHIPMMYLGIKWLS